MIQQDVHVLKEAEYLKDEFIGLAAHELRTPVTALKGAIGTLLTRRSRTMVSTRRLAAGDAAGDRSGDGSAHRADR